MSADRLSGVDAPEDREDVAARRRRLPRRHPAEVTADRLGDAVEKWFDKFDDAERDMIGQLKWAFDQIASGER